MLDFDSVAASGEPHTRTSQVRHGERWGRMVEQAAQALGVDKSTFVRAVVEREASRVLQAQTRHVLSPADAARFAAALDAVPEPTPRALKAAGLYRARMGHAD